METSKSESDIIDGIESQHVHFESFVSSEMSEPA